MNRFRTLLFVFLFAFGLPGWCADGQAPGGKAVSSSVAYTYYVRGYAALEFGRIMEAKSLLEQAVALSPHNSKFLSELGNVYEAEQNWPLALETFQRAEAAAKEFSPSDERDAHLSSAWRGMGFVYSKLNKLDDAEKMYRQCLELNKKDAQADFALRYIEYQRNTKPAGQ